MSTSAAPRGRNSMLNVRYYGRFRAAIQKVVAKACAKQGFAHIQIITDWRKVVGEQLAEISAPVMLYFPYNEDRDGTLVCGVSNPSYVLRLQMQIELMIQRVNVYFGYNAIAKIKFKFSPGVAAVNDSAGYMMAAGAAGREAVAVEAGVGRGADKQLVDQGSWDAIGLALAEIDDEEVRAACRRLADALFLIGPDADPSIKK